MDRTGSVSLQFADVYAGAGGLSFGLMLAGFQGLFAIEKSPMAFETLQHNLIGVEDELRFDWPEWLPKEATSIEAFLLDHEEQAKALEGLPLLAGGPPCQGYSTAGRRKVGDERNRLFERYIELVRLVRPKMLLVENVRGFASPFKKSEKGSKGVRVENEIFNAAQQLQRQLEELGYKVFTPDSGAIMAKDFGVPQLRPRYILIAIEESFLRADPGLNPFDLLLELRPSFLANLGFPIDRAITVKEAISDLEKAHGCAPCNEPGMHRFNQGKYGPMTTRYQALFRSSRKGDPLPPGLLVDSHRFSNHREATVQRFTRIMDEGRPGIGLSPAERKEMKINKHVIARLAENEPSHTLTSLPDDLIHYIEPRILTVREYARIQSFPDWYKFKSEYTTGSIQRRTSVPRYTQVANAVPPLLAWALGLVLTQVHNRLVRAADQPVDGLPTGGPIHRQDLQMEMEMVTANPVGQPV